MVLRVLVATTSLILCIGWAPLAVAADAMSLLSLNLHGYHPTGASQRVLQTRDGRTQLANSHLHYFSEQELQDGNVRRLDVLASRIETLAPDVILLQEVGAGWPGHTHNCRDFYAVSDQEQRWTNVAVRLRARLKQKAYQVHLACRGNVGWQTNSDTFAQQRVLNETGAMIFDLGANPYPQGLLIEGFAILVSDEWRVTDSGFWRLRQNDYGDVFQVQYAVVAPKGDANPSHAVGVINIHGGHKVGHFEQAVALREAISGLMEYTKVPPASWVVGGDFNVSLYRPTRDDDAIDASAVAWEVASKSHFDFDLTTDATSKAQKLRQLLTTLNNNRSYKDYATIVDRQRAAARIDAAVARFQRWQYRVPASSYQLTEALELAEATGRCKPPSVPHVACTGQARIDNIFFGGNLTLQNAYMAFTDSSYFHLRGISDHPGIFARFSFLAN